MKIFFIYAILVTLSLFGCNNKPEPQPNINQLSVYPNPARDLFTVSINNVSQESYTLQVFGTDGALIFEAEDNLSGFNSVVDIVDKPKGNYEVILKKGNVKMTQRVLKI